MPNRREGVEERREIERRGAGLREETYRVVEVE